MVGVSHAMENVQGMLNAEWCDQLVIHSEMDNNIPNGGMDIY